MLAPVLSQRKEKTWFLATWSIQCGWQGLWMWSYSTRVFLQVYFWCLWSLFSIRVLPHLRATPISVFSDLPLGFQYKYTGSGAPRNSCPSNLAYSNVTCAGAWNFKCFNSNHNKLQDVSHTPGLCCRIKWRVSLILTSCSFWLLPIPSFPNSLQGSPGA